MNMEFDLLELEVAGKKPSRLDLYVLETGFATGSGMTLGLTGAGYLLQDL